MESDIVLEISEADLCKSEYIPLDEQDTNYVTPTKNKDDAPRRSPRVPKPKLMLDYVTPTKGTPAALNECPDTVPSSPVTPKSKTTSTPKVSNEESELDTPATPVLERASFDDSFVIPISISKMLDASPQKTPSKTPGRSNDSGVPVVDTPASPNLEAASTDSFIAPTSISRILLVSPKKTPNKTHPVGNGSGNTPAVSETDTPPKESISLNDSFIAPLSISKILQASPKKTPNNTQLKIRSGLTPTKNTPPATTDDPFYPSPYKSHRPKYLPKNVKLVKKKRLERNAFLENVEKFDAQLLKLPSMLKSPKKLVNPIISNDGDLMGTQTPLFVIFHPENFFATYDEDSFENHFDVDIAGIRRSVTLYPHLVCAKEFRALVLFLTVTSDASLYNTVSSYLEDFLVRGEFFLGWDDLKGTLTNLGLSKDFYQFDSSGYYGIDPPKTPNTWNFEFLFMLVEHSFPSYSKNRLVRLVKFLVDCMFDPILLPCFSTVVSLLRQVLEHLIREGASVEEMVLPLNHTHYSFISNRLIIQSLSPSPLLRPLATALAYRTVHAILRLDYGGDSSASLSNVADLLVDVRRIREKTTVKDVYQLIIICENLVSMGPSPFNSETKSFLERLADFAERMSLVYTCFENLHFTDTVTRLKTISAIDSF